MKKTDISKKELFIGRMIGVFATTLGSKPRLWKIGGRHSDAFVFILEGPCKCTFTEDGYSFFANTGDVLYLARDAVYTMEATEGVYSSIYCDFEFDTGEARKSAVFTPKNPSETEALFRRLLSHYTHPSRHAFFDCMSLLYLIYGTIFTANDKGYLNQNTKERVRSAKEFIDSAFRDPTLSVPRVANSVGMSEVYLRKLFRSQYGDSPLGYINSVRLKNAMRLMQYPFLSLEECALQSGFSSLPYFCRVFKKSTGISPGAFRKKNL